MYPARTILGGEIGWPARLGALEDAPERLRVRGNPGEAGCRRVAVVGSRRADPCGVEMAGSIARDLALAGVCIVSGGAEGIDAAAHQGAMRAGGPTIAVLGTGVDVAYPAAHRSLFDRILSSGGALISEYEDGTPAARWTFPKRNRIVSGMSEAVVVVRGTERSGALNTARWARRQGVPVLAAPGDVREEGSAGPIALLRSGAKVAASARDVLEAIGLAGQLSLPSVESDGDLEGEEAALLGALARVPRHADELARAAGVSAATALSALLVLELRGLCEQRPGHYFLRRA
jgi:DNA processing protein